MTENKEDVAAGKSMGRREAIGGRTMTSPMLKAMTHPLRRRIMSVLSAQDYARAADLSEQLDVPANKLSYHLRILADSHMIREAPEFARDKRDRVWQAVEGSYQIGSPEAPLSAEGEMELGSYLSQMELDQRHALSKVMAWAPDFATGKDANSKAELATGTVRLTPEEAQQMFENILQVVREAGKLHREPGEEGVQTWDYTFMALREDL